ncbi:hypothetical protein VF21_10067 [Pseudogymnoascus sp. 05NY08]|nr:hypothetical protein VF21_10067 [Pseudogymnoascus sp. 05NY08]
MSFKNDGVDVLSCDYFQPYSNIKRSIRYNLEDLLVTQGIAAAALTLPESAAKGPRAYGPYSNVPSAECRAAPRPMARTRPDRERRGPSRRDAMAWDETGETDFHAREIPQLPLWTGGGAESAQPDLVPRT